MTNTQVNNHSTVSVSSITSGAIKEHLVRIVITDSLHIDKDVTRGCVT